MQLVVRTPQNSVWGQLCDHHGMLRWCVDDNYGQVHGMRDSRNGPDEVSMEPRLQWFGQPMSYTGITNEHDTSAA